MSGVLPRLLHPPRSQSAQCLRSARVHAVLTGRCSPSPRHVVAYAGRGPWGSISMHSGRCVAVPAAGAAISTGAAVPAMLHACFPSGPIIYAAMAPALGSCQHEATEQFLGLRPGFASYKHPVSCSSVGYKHWPQLSRNVSFRAANGTHLHLQIPRQDQSLDGMSFQLFYEGGTWPQLVSRIRQVSRLLTAATVENPPMHANDLNRGNTAVCAQQAAVRPVVLSWVPAAVVGANLTAAGCCCTVAPQALAMRAC